MHNYNIVYLMMFFVFSLAGASSIIGRLNLYELQVSVLSTDDLFEKTKSCYTVDIFNPRQDRDSFALECGNTDTTESIHHLKALQTRSVSLCYTPTKRGISVLPTLRLGSHFPLPHELLFRDIDLNYETVVFPEPKGKSLDSFSSKHRFHIGEFDDFEGIRSYHEGESLSHIYWPSIAKGGPLMSKEFTLLENSRHLHFHFVEAAEDDEARLSQLCLWAIECKKRNIPYTMHFPDTSLDSTSRSHHEILRFLALY